jgi:tripartite ATP-independent transporter DctM subunit
MGWMAFLMFLCVIVVLMAGYPVAFTLGGMALIFSAIGLMTHTFDPIMTMMPQRLFGIMTNQTLVAVPLFVFMGVMLERTRIAEELLETMGLLFGRMRGGLAISVTLVGMLLAASTGIVGATVVTMGLLSLPTMLKRGYAPSIACGTICASGTLGQIIPPSIILILLGDVLSAAYQQAQLKMGIFSADTVSVGDLFIGAIIPGLILVGMYLLYLLFAAWRNPQGMPAAVDEDHEMPSDLSMRVIKVLLPPLLLILAVLGSIIGGLATPTEAASVGAMGGIFLAWVHGQLSWSRMREVVTTTTKISSMVFMIFIGASMFSLAFRGFGGDEAVHQVLSQLPGGVVGAMIVVMLVMFLLGFVLDFIEITFVVIPIVGPVLLMMGLDPVWLGIMIAINLQTSFLTPPFGFSLFYLRGVAPEEVATRDIYRGVMPFITIQLLVLGLLAMWPGLVTWLPGIVYSH